MKQAMKLIAATLALALLGSTAAAAQPGPRNFGPRGGPEVNRGFDRDRGRPGGFNRGDRFDRNRGGFGFGFGPGFGPGPGFGAGFGYDRFYRPPYSYGWRLGGRFLPPYGTHYIVVNDWYRYHLRRPPIGYHWVRVNSDFLLVGIASGIIADLLLNHYSY